jgi:hypothetical protein
MCIQVSPHLLNYMARKLILTTCIAIGLCIIGFVSNAQSVSNNKKQVDSIMKTLPTSPRPTPEMFNKVCEYANKNNRQYKRMLVVMSGADPAKDATLVITAKLRKMWVTYSNDFKNDTYGFIGSHIRSFYRYDYLEGDQPEINAIITKLPPCPKPSDYLSDKICDCIKTGSIEYKTAFLELSCADLVNDPPLVIMAKVQRLWNTYHAELHCTDKQMNILQYAVNRNFHLFLDGIVEIYGLDINWVSPSDKKTLLDFARDQSIRYRTGGDIDTANQLLGVYEHLKNNLGAKHAAEL